MVRALEDAPITSNTLVIHTDSSYSKLGMAICLTLPSTSILTNTGLSVFVHAWRRNGWKKANGDPVKNRPLIEYLASLIELRRRCGQRFRIEQVKAHSGNEGNDGADALAVAGCAMPIIPERSWAQLKEETDYKAIDLDVSPPAQPLTRTL